MWVALGSGGGIARFSPDGTLRDILVVIVLVSLIVAANYHDLPATRYISLFPMVILTGMIERFWTLEVEDSTGSSFRTLLYTMHACRARSAGRMSRHTQPTSATATR